VPDLVHRDVEVDEDRSLVVLHEGEPAPDRHQEQGAHRLVHVQATLDVVGLDGSEGAHPAVIGSEDDGDETGAAFGGARLIRRGGRI
jgi:hypothetical protein